MKREMGKQETILLVDDDAQLLGLLKDMLELLNYDVMHTTNPDFAIMIADGHKGNLDLLITDMTMPGMDGDELATKILLGHPETKVLYISGYNNNVVEEGASFIGKPFNLVEMSKKIRDVIENR